MTLDGPGTQVLAGSNTYIGSTTITEGTLQIGSGGASGTIGSGTSTIAVSNANAMLAYDLSVASTLSRSVTGSGGLMQLGTGTLVLTGTNDAYNGITTIGSSATLQLGSGAAAGSLSGTGAVTDNGTLAFDLSGSPTFSHTISGSGGVTQMAASLLRLSGTNSYTGPTTISARTLQFGSTAALGNSLTVSISTSAVLDLNGYSPTIGSLAGNGTVTNTAASGTSTLTLRRCWARPPLSAASSRTAVPA